MKDLSKIPIGDLLAEVRRRHKDVAEYEESLSNNSIKAEAKSKKLTLAVQYLRAAYGGPPQYILGIIKKGEFKDFYYNSGLKNFGRFIPNGFHESMESTYEYTADLNEGLEKLKKAGYTHFEETYE
jgi:hypothetical protein